MPMRGVLGVDELANAVDDHLEHQIDVEHPADAAHRLVQRGELPPHTVRAGLGLRRCERELQRAGQRDGLLSVASQHERAEWCATTGREERQQDGRVGRVRERDVQIGQWSRACREARHADAQHGRELLDALADRAPRHRVRIPTPRIDRLEERGQDHRPRCVDAHRLVGGGGHARRVLRSEGHLSRTADLRTTRARTPCSVRRS